MQPASIGVGFFVGVGVGFFVGVVLLPATGILTILPSLPSSSVT